MGGEMDLRWYRTYKLGDTLTLFRAAPEDKVLYTEFHGGVWTTVAFEEARDWIEPWFGLEEGEERKIYELRFTPRKPMFMHEKVDEFMNILEENGMIKPSDVFYESTKSVLKEGVLAEVDQDDLRAVTKRGYDCIITTDEHGEINLWNPWVVILDPSMIEVVASYESTPRTDEQIMAWTDEVDPMTAEKFSRLRALGIIEEVGETMKTDEQIIQSLWDMYSSDIEYWADENVALDLKFPEAMAMIKVQQDRLNILEQLPQEDKADYVRMIFHRYHAWNIDTDTEVEV